MIRNSKGEECDECGAEFWGGTLEFRDMLNEAKATGWKILKDVGDDQFRGDGPYEWTHTCPDCEAS